MWLNSQCAELTNYIYSHYHKKYLCQVFFHTLYNIQYTTLYQQIFPLSVFNESKTKFNRLSVNSIVLKFLPPKMYYNLK